MNLLLLLSVRRPVLFESALRDADTAQLHALHGEAASLDPRRRELLEAELARRKAANFITWTTLFTVLVLGGGALIFLDHAIARS